MRPETCQSLFTNFRNICDTTRNRIPFGLAQIGKAFRNEITPGQFLFRTREFEQMEIEYFVPADPESAMKVFEEWKTVSMEFWTKIIKISSEHLRYKDHDKLAHYAAAATDIEFAFPLGFGEVQGIPGAIWAEVQVAQAAERKGNDHRVGPCPPFGRT